MDIPQFITIETTEQILELREYLASLGAKIALQNRTSDSITNEDISDIVKCCDVVFSANLDEGSLEDVLNSIVTILMATTDVSVINSFCEKLTGVAYPDICFRVLYNFYIGIKASPVCYDVYCALLKVAATTGHVLEIYEGLNKLKEWMAQIELPIESIQRLYRILHHSLLGNQQSEAASKVMVELLSTYTEDTASQARDDAQRCIVSFLADPNTFLMDHLLPLKPVASLKGELIHQLLLIFVKEKLPAYNTFYAANKDFINGLGLDHAQNQRKMRVLTFMQIGEVQKVVSFEQLKKELEITDVEEFIIEILKTKLVSARINQVEKTVEITTTMHRTFGAPQWEILRDTLLQWHEKLEMVEMSMLKVTEAEFEQRPIHA